MKTHQTERIGCNQNKNRPYYEAVVFLMLVTAWVVQVPDVERLSPYTSVYYVLSFSDFGFQTRILIGSIVTAFSNYVSNRVIYIIISVLSAAFIGIISLVVGHLMRIIAQNESESIWILPTLLLACPLSIQYLFNANNYGRYDLFSIEMAVLILFCIRSEKGKWALPFLCFFAMLLNFNFAVMYMPSMAAVMLYELAAKPKSKARLFIFLISCIVVVGSFVYFKIPAQNAAFADPGEVGQYLTRRTDVNLKGAEIQVFFDFFKFTNWISHFNKQSTWIIDLLKTYLPYVILMNLPMLVFFISFWVEAVRTINIRSKRLIYLLFALLPLFGLPMFLAADWDRWFPTLFISQLMVLFYLVATNDRTTLNVLRRLHGFLLHHELLTVISLIFLASGMYSRIHSVFESVILKYIDLIRSFN